MTAKRFRPKYTLSTGLSFALTYGMIFVLSGSVFLGFVWLSAVHAMERSSIKAIHAETDTLLREWHAGGTVELRNRLRERIRESTNHENVYLFIDKDSRFLEGNMSCWPKQATYPGQDYAIIAGGGCFPGIIELTWRFVPDGGRIVVGRDLRNIAVLKRVLAEALLWAAVMSLALGAGGALVVRKLFKNIVETIAETTVAISQGDLTQRLPLTGNEIDIVSRTINKMLDRIAHLMEGIRNVSNAIAHDLRTPITRARNTLEDAVMRENSAEGIRLASLRAVQELDHVKAVFEAILRIAQLETGAKRAAFIQHDLKPFLEDIADLYRPTAEECDIALHDALPATIPFYGDARLIQQAIANLLDNAIKFSPAHTAITLKAFFSNDKLVLAVQDQGMGMRAEDLKRATERFYRTESSRHLPGSGLGLTLVQAVATLHEGSLVIEPQTQGLRVALHLPLKATHDTLNRFRPEDPSSI